MSASLTYDCGEPVVTFRYDGKTVSVVFSDDTISLLVLEGNRLAYVSEDVQVPGMKFV